MISSFLCLYLADTGTSSAARKLHADLTKEIRTFLSSHPATSYKFNKLLKDLNEGSSLVSPLTLFSFLFIFLIDSLVVGRTFVPRACLSLSLSCRTKTSCPLLGDMTVLIASCAWFPQPNFLIFPDRLSSCSCFAFFVFGVCCPFLVVRQ